MNGSGLLIFHAEEKVLPAVAAGFNAATISLDATIESRLDWSKEAAFAASYAEQGYRIFWEIDLGLASLENALMSESRLLTLCLSLDHFRDSLYSRFAAETCGCSLYCGLLEAAVAYQEPLLLLAERLPGGVSGHVIVDATELSRNRQARLFTSPLFQYLRPIVKGAKLPLNEAVWQEGFGNEVFLGRYLPEKKRALLPNPKVLVCLPSLEDGGFDDLEQVFEALEKESVPFFLVTESNLANMWEGIQTIVASKVSASGKRLLHGFVVADGELVAAGEELGVQGEIPFAEWIPIK